MILDGKGLAQKIKDDLKKELEKTGEQVTLAVILAGNDPASEIYVGSKIRACSSVGIKSILKRFPIDVTEKELLNAVEELNNDDDIDGILVQLPLPKGLNEDKIVNAVSPEKDVDCLTYEMQGRLAYGAQIVAPCTPLGIMTLLSENGIDPTGLSAVVIGRSNLCGKPLAVLLEQANATVTLCHSKTKNLSEVTKTADIVAICTGKKEMLKPDMVKKGAIVIDVGIHRTEQGIVGDVLPETFEKCSYYTPVPGGVGPMTIATLLTNTLALHRHRR